MQYSYTFLAILEIKTTNSIFFHQIAQDMFNKCLLLFM